MNEELRTCPFCGSEAKLFEDKGLWSVYCSNHGCLCSPTGSRFIYKDECVNTWNKRCSPEVLMSDECTQIINALMENVRQLNALLQKTGLKPREEAGV